MSMRCRRGVEGCRGGLGCRGGHVDEVSKTCLGGSLSVFGLHAGAWCTARGVLVACLCIFICFCVLFHCFTYLFEMTCLGDAKGRAGILHL